MFAKVWWIVLNNYIVIESTLLFSFGHNLYTRVRHILHLEIFKENALQHFLALFFVLNWNQTKIYHVTFLKNNFLLILKF